mmetsp:Transcript_50653/g.134934  ORF Transcript_50653/g.134934 Transcript_50653/m.134934 type:complete len:250 (+) Transcript_50653:284-1033(+)
MRYSKPKLGRRFPENFQVEATFSLHLRRIVVAQTRQTRTHQTFWPGVSAKRDISIFACSELRMSFRKRLNTVTPTSKPSATAMASPMKAASLEAWPRLTQGGESRTSMCSGDTSCNTAHFSSSARCCIWLAARSMAASCASSPWQGLSTSNPSRSSCRLASEVDNSSSERKMPSCTSTTCATDGNRNLLNCFSSCSAPGRSRSQVVSSSRLRGVCPVGSDGAHAFSETPPDGTDTKSLRDNSWASSLVL